MIDSDHFLTVARCCALVAGDENVSKKDRQVFSKYARLYSLLADRQAERGSSLQGHHSHSGAPSLSAIAGRHYDDAA